MARSREAPLIAWSRNRASPPVGRINPARMRSRLVLPDPDAPTMQRNSPSRTSRSIFARMARRPAPGAAKDSPRPRSATAGLAWRRAAAAAVVVVAGTSTGGSQKSVVVSEDPHFIGWTLFSVFQVELRRWLSNDDPSLQQGLRSLERALRLVISRPDKGRIEINHAQQETRVQGPAASDIDARE